jgi:hypothetical protein
MDMRFQVPNLRRQVTSLNSLRTVRHVNDVLNPMCLGLAIFRTSLSILMRITEQFGGMKMDLDNVIMSEWAEWLSRYDCLRAGRSGDRIPEGARLSAPVQTGPEPTQPPVKSVPSLSQG